MKKTLFAIFVFCYFLNMNSLNASEVVNREILDMGCHLNDNTCYVTLSGEAVGPEGCKAINVRWNESSTANGKNILALLTTAFVAEKNVKLRITDSCYGIYPTFDYITILR